MAGLVCPDPGKYESVSKNTVSGEIRYAWRYTFQIISSLLDRMGFEANPEAGVRIDLEESEHARHIKLIFASGGSDVFHYSLLGLFAGSTVSLSKARSFTGSISFLNFSFSLFEQSVFCASKRKFPKRSLSAIALKATCGGGSKGLSQ